MKTTRTFALALSIVATLSGSAFAGNEGKPVAAKSAHAMGAFAHKTYMSTSRHNSLTIITLKQEATPVEVSIVSASGETLYQDRIKGDSVLRHYDVNALPSGTYRVELRRGGQIEAETFTVR